MARELKIALDTFDDTGLTLLGKVYTSAGTQQGASVSMTEGDDAVYVGDFALAAVADGEYMVRFETNTPDLVYGTGALYVRGGTEVSQWELAKKSETVSSNIVKVNSVAVDGTGTAVDPWGPE